jgi:hypothetical protein
MPKIINQWSFSVDIEGINLVNVSGTDKFLLLKKYTYFKAVDDNYFFINGLGLNNIIKLNRNECVVPTPNTDMLSFLDSLMLLLST